MTDFETAARRAVDEPVFPPTDPDRIRQRAARLRRRHRTRLGAGVGAVLAAVGLAVWAALPGASSSQQVATGPTTPSASNPLPGPALPAGWQRASAAQVDAFATRIGSQAALDYQATWSVVLLPSRTGPRHATVESAADAHGLFYKLTPASGFSMLPSPPGLTTTGKPGTSYSYYEHFTGKALSASCSTSPQPPHAWKCVSWQGIQYGMGTSFYLQSPSPPYSSASGVSNAILHYGYGNPGGVDFPTEPAYISHRRQFGLKLTCLRFGPVHHPVGRVCADRSGLVTSYQFPAAATISSPYTSITLTSYQPNPPTSILNPPAPPTKPTGHY